MKDDFFFLHQSFDEDNLPTEIILVQIDSFFDGGLEHLLAQKLNLPIKHYCSFKDCWQYLILKTSPFCLIAGDFSKEGADITAMIKKLRKEFSGFATIVLQGRQREAQTVVEEGIRYLTAPFFLEKLLSSIHQTLQEGLGNHSPYRWKTDEIYSKKLCGKYVSRNDRRIQCHEENF